jgi:hypothetical protein
VALARPEAQGRQVDDFSHPRAPWPAYRHVHRCFVWTKTADEILKKANRQTTSNTDH